ncbi:hypothetical protein BaRGS_00018227 [Batillaria attramentaria]|uniref:Uncharacterized protein n=1 Tax=Batillaria attramentaria TaxID=370345 RepID=A0ABD0KTN2_9CAEN
MMKDEVKPARDPAVGEEVNAFSKENVTMPFYFMAGLGAVIEKPLASVRNRNFGLREAKALSMELRDRVNMHETLGAAVTDMEDYLHRDAHVFARAAIQQSNGDYGPSETLLYALGDARKTGNREVRSSSIKVVVYYFRKYDYVSDENYNTGYRHNADLRILQNWLNKDHPAIARLLHLNDRELETIQVKLDDADPNKHLQAYPGKEDLYNSPVIPTYFQLHRNNKNNI